MKDTSKISLLSAISIGIGGMVGGGIFAVLGLAVALSQGATPVAFLIAGFIAILTAYSYSKLSVAYPDEGGTVRFINEGFGETVFSGGVNNLLWVSYIVMLALYSSAFGSYAPNLISITGDEVIDKHLFISLVVIVCALINYLSVKFVGEIESVAVVVKLIILIVFVVVGLYGITASDNYSQLSAENWEGPLQIIAGGMVIFVAYEGFELIANSSSDIEKPIKNIPKAYFISTIFVVLLYLAIAVVTVGRLDFDTIAKAEDYVLAEAAKPTFGQAGFVVITIAALISTFSAINATLLGGSRVNYVVAESDELPKFFTRIFHGKPIGLLVITVLTLVLANTLNLESISTSGSFGFLLVFAMVNWISFKKSKEINSKKYVSLLGAILSLIAVLVLLFQQIQTNLSGMLVAIGIVVASFVAEYIYKYKESRTTS